MSNAHACEPGERLSAYRKVQRRYAHYAPNYDRIWGNYSEATLSRAEAMIRRHAPHAHGLLDVACGTGLLEERLAHSMPHLQMTGVDVSDEMLERARARLGERVTWRVATAEALPVHDASFDIVACCNAFHLITDHSDALAEFRRALRPGGTLIIVDWCRDYLTVKLIAAGYRILPGHPRHIRTAEELAAVVRDVDFEIIETQRFRATRFFKLTALAARRQ